MRKNVYAPMRKNVTVRQTHVLRLLITLVWSKQLKTAKIERVISSCLKENW
jgi:hypothetical protein